MSIRRFIFCAATGLAVILFLQLLWGGQAHAAAEYEEEMKVRLIPSQNFFVTPNGSYRLLNLDTGESLDYSGEIEFRYSSSNRVGIRTDSSEDVQYSRQGFRFEERTADRNHEVTITSVRVAGASSYTTNTYRGSLEILPAADDEDRLRLYNILDIDDYLRGVVPREVSASWHTEALKAQAVAARNYAKVNMESSDYLTDTTQHQVYAGKTGEDPRTNRAVQDTRKRYAIHNGNLINAYYHASSGGHTDDSENVWSSQVPYIRGVEDPYDNHPSNPRHEWGPVRITAEEMGREVFGSDWSVTDFEIRERSDAGRVQEVRVTGANNNGETETVTMPNGSADSLRWEFGETLNSTMFDAHMEDVSTQIRDKDGEILALGSLVGVEMAHAGGDTKPIAGNNLPVRTHEGVEYLPVSGDVIEFTGGGWGHGLGMSQWGALGMAEAGYTYEEILQHYFTDIQIERR